MLAAWPGSKLRQSTPPTGRLQRIYESATGRAGRVAGIIKLMSPQPAVLQASMQLYMATTTSPDAPLPRWFREWVAVQVSHTNDCSY